MFKSLVPGFLNSPFLILFILSFALSDATEFEKEVKKEKTHHYQFFQKSLVFLNDLDGGNIEQAVSHFQMGFDLKILKTQIFETWNYLTNTYGEFVSFSSLRFRKEFPEKAVYGKLVLERRILGLRLGYGASDKLVDFQILTDLSLLPDKQVLPRPYVDHSKFKIRTLQMGSRQYPLRANLYLPFTRSQASPVLVFTHDFGPQGMFQRIGVNTVFKDLAEGLASAGYAVLLYPKRTFVYPEERKKTITPSWEILEDLYSSLYHLKNQVDLQGSPIFHVGYGFSTYFVPFLIQKSLFDGYILLNPSLRSPLRLLFEDKEYRALFNGTSTQVLEGLSQKIEEFSLSNLKDDEYLFDYPVSYFRKLRRYIPDQLVQTYRPILAVFALSDHSYHSEDRFEVERILNGAKFNTLLFPGLNGALQKSHHKNPQLDYFTPGIVEPELIFKLVEWLKEQH